MPARGPGVACSSRRFPLDEIDHPLLRKAAGQFAAEGTPHERIRAIDDVVLFKVKSGRWRGAVYSDDDPGADVRDWLVAAAPARKDRPMTSTRPCTPRRGPPGSATTRSHDKALTTDTHAAHLLPGPDDHDRLLIEAGTRLARRLNATVRELVRGSLRDGHEHAADFAGFRLGIIVRAEDGHETYVAIRITGSVHRGLTAVILGRVPGCAPDAWFPSTPFPNGSCSRPSRHGPTSWIPRQLRSYSKNNPDPATSAAEALAGGTTAPIR